METIIVEISIPAINEKVDFKLPSTGKIKDIVDEMVRILELTKGNIQFDSDTRLLCDLDHERILNPNLTAAKESITDGSKLMLI